MGPGSDGTDLETVSGTRWRITVMADQDLEEQAPETTQKGGGMATTAINLGIIGIVFGCISTVYFFFFGGLDAYQEVLRNM